MAKSEDPDKIAASHSISLGSALYAKIKSIFTEGAQWLSGRVLDLRPRGHGFEPHRRHCVVSLRKNINPSLVLVQPRKTRPFVTERLLMGRKESNQTKTKNQHVLDDSSVYKGSTFRPPDKSA